MFERRFLEITTDEDIKIFEDKIEKFKNHENEFVKENAWAFHNDSMYINKPKNPDSCVMYRGSTRPPEDIYKNGFTPKYDDFKDHTDAVTLTKSTYIGSLYGDIQMKLQGKTTGYVYAVLLEKNEAANFSGQTLAFSTSKKPDGNGDLGKIDLMEYRSSAVSPSKILAARKCNGNGDGPEDDLIVNKLAYNKNQEKVKNLAKNDAHFAKFWTRPNSKDLFHHEESKKDCLKKAPFVPDYY